MARAKPESRFVEFGLLSTCNSPWWGPVEPPALERSGGRVAPRPCAISQQFSLSIEFVEFIEFRVVK